METGEEEEKTEAAERGEIVREKASGRGRHGTLLRD